MEGIEEKKRKGWSIGSDRREEEIILKVDRYSRSSRKINRYKYNQFKLKKEKKINDQAELILFLFKIRGAGGMEGIKEKKKKKKVDQLDLIVEKKKTIIYKKKMVGIADRWEKNRYKYNRFWWSTSGAITWQEGKRKDRLIGALIVFPRHVFFFFFFIIHLHYYFFFFFKLIITFCSKIFHIRVKEKEKKK